MFSVLYLACHLQMLKARTETHYNKSPNLTFCKYRAVTITLLPLCLWKDVYLPEVHLTGKQKIYVTISSPSFMESDPT